MSATTSLVDVIGFCCFSIINAAHVSSPYWKFRLTCLGLMFREIIKHTQTIFWYRAELQIKKKQFAMMPILVQYQIWKRCMFELLFSKANPISGWLGGLKYRSWFVATHTHIHTVIYRRAHMRAADKPHAVSERDRGKSTAVRLWALYWSPVYIIYYVVRRYRLLLFFLSYTLRICILRIENFVWLVWAQFSEKL